ncbi:MAG: methyltransferase domain-containing protein [Verrucomicrobia bacterium]|nr:methyltransferase domain-containing protein [Verrucomicrobiota bacterium]
MKARHFVPPRMAGVVPVAAGVLLGLLLGVPRPVHAADAAKADTAVTRTPDVVFVPTPQQVVEKMLELAEVKKGDVLYDLGCGDGRIVVTAAKKYGVKAIGFDIDPKRVEESLANVKSNKVEHLVTIKQADIFTLDLREASVVTLYLLPELNVRLMPQLEKLKPGSRIVSHDFDMRGRQAAGGAPDARHQCGAMGQRRRRLRRRRAHDLQVGRSLGTGSQEALKPQFSPRRAAGRRGSPQGFPRRACSRS